MEVPGRETWVTPSVSVRSSHWLLAAFIQFTCIQGPRQQGPRMSLRRAAGWAARCCPRLLAAGSPLSLHPLLAERWYQPGPHREMWPTATGYPCLAFCGEPRVSPYREEN
ncbi:hypothetical protein NDU88_003968 [Pleurodeles waltl]|uniref:Uncharacterized protein n=1 Tax=Pleurodeles waltl TaxID=8319 RepID=A0AAV7QH37_PLEWA|nr:hypothetical protein NDU88_003968 [Pleurodeles waltl]